MNKGKNSHIIHAPVLYAGLTLLYAMFFGILVGYAAIYLSALAGAEVSWAITNAMGASGLVAAAIGFRGGMKWKEKNIHRKN